MSPKDDPANEGHTREWQDRARVVLNAKKDAHTEASPNQSPVRGSDEDREDVEEKSGRVKKNREEDDEPVY